MNLLLILSALLSALTGAMGSRVPEIGLYQSAAAIRADVRTAAVPAVSLRPDAKLPGLSAVSVYPGDRMLALAAAVPAYASRRRE